MKVKKTKVMKSKKNWYLISAIVIIIGILGFAGYQFYDDNFSYAKDYYKIKSECYEKNNLNNNLCETFRSAEGQSTLATYIESEDPAKRFKDLDAITLTVTLIGSNPFNYFGILLPLVIALIVIGTTNKKEEKQKKETKLSFKSFIIKNKKVLKVALLMPTILIFIYIVSCFITKFNFNYDDIVFPIGTYDGFMYTNFSIYLIMICLIQYILSLVYASFALLALKINKNKILAIGLSYIFYVLLYVFILYVLYIGVLQNLLDMSNMFDYFNIVGYYLFTNKNQLLFGFLFSLVLLLVTTIPTYLVYKRKQ